MLYVCLRFVFNPFVSFARCILHDVHVISHIYLVFILFYLYFLGFPMVR